MIIRIDRVSPDKYAAFLSTDTGDVCISPPHLSFSYTTMLAGRVKNLLSLETAKVITILYPANNNSRFDEPSNLYQREHWGIPQASDEVSLNEVLRDFSESKSPVPLSHNGKEVPVGTARWRAKFKTPFTSQKTFEGIKQQARNVAERATLSDYDTFVSNMVKLVAQLQDDLKTRWDEEKAKVAKSAVSEAKRIIEWWAGDGLK